jgi:hypothetical protein
LRIEPTRPDRIWLPITLGVFLFCLLYTFLGVWSRGPTTFVPVTRRPERARMLTEQDVRFGVWGASRNAWVLARAPWRIFDAEPCHPVRRSLALGHPMISLGIVGAPVRLAVSDPVLTYNLVLAIVFLASALAMYLLVVDWTGSPPAGIVAGMLYAFHPVAVDRVIHLYIYDTSWTVWALLFAYRLFTRSRWRDGLGLGAAFVMQMAGSFYCAAIGFFVGLPLAVWVVWQNRQSRFPTGPAFAALAIALIGAAAIYTPFLEARATEGFARRAQFFASWSSFFPGAPRDPGVWMWILVACGLLGGRSRACAAIRGDPRWAIAIGAFLVTLAATAGGGLLDLHRGVEAWLLGFEAIRVPGLLAGGTPLTLSLLAGLGTSVVTRWAPTRYAWSVAGTLVAVSLLLATLRPPLLGFSPRVSLYGLHARPAEDEIEFFEALAEEGDTGPILELPLQQNAVHRLAKSVLLTSYHHRRTASCYNSIWPQAFREVVALSNDLPDDSAVQRVRELGFTTILVRHPGSPWSNPALQRRFQQAAEDPESGLRLLHATPVRSAFALPPTRSSSR